MSSDNYEYILIDSYKRSKGSPSDFVYELNRPIRDIKRLELVYSSFSNTILTFTTDDFLYLIQEGQSNVISIRFENQSLTSDEFVTFLSSKLNSEGRSGYAVSIDNKTFKITLSNNSTNFKILFSYQNSVYRRLGFKNEDTPFRAIHTSDYVSNLEASDYLLIQIRNVATLITTKNTSGTFFIPVVSSRYEVQTINENQSFNQSIYTGNLDLSNIDIKILDDEGELIKSNELNLKLLLKCYK
jgi:hypothetical protein